MKTYPVLLAFVLLAGCKKDDLVIEERLVDFRSFTVQLPSSWREFKLMGIDSQVGGMTDGTDTLQYDYGMYSYKLTDETAATHIITESVRNGYQTKFVRPKKPGEGVIGIHYDLGNYMHLTILGNRCKDESTASRILQSVKIK